MSIPAANSETAVPRAVQLRALELAIHGLNGAHLEIDERCVARNVLTALACIVDSPAGGQLVREVDALMRPVVGVDNGRRADWSAAGRDQR